MFRPIVSTTHPSPRAIVNSLGDISPCPTVSEIELKFPTTPQEIVGKFRDHIKSLPKLEGKKRVAVLDTIVANPGALIPWQKLVKICKEENILSIVDAAHSIGQEQNINLTEVAPDFWVSVCRTSINSGKRHLVDPGVELSQVVVYQATRRNVLHPRTVNPLSLCLPTD